MSETIKLSVCPKCHAPIPTEAPQGLCPKCVLGGAANPTEIGGSATATGEIPSIARISAAFPQLEILELIGRGGMGFVFKARQPHLDRYVALKLLPDKLASDPQFAERFNREGRFLAKLNHPNIVSVFDFGQAGGFYFLLMEYVDGVNLRQAMRAGRFSPAEALAIVPKICEALQYAHEQGVLHRDIKPENILLDAKGRVKIADFGIAKMVGEDAHAFTLTGTGHALGTPHYMAPEQLEKPGEVDHRADIYSLGVVFYEMLTGELPIGRFKPPSERTPLDYRVDEIVMRALERERELRQKNATEFKTQVERVTSEPLSGSDRARAAKSSVPIVREWSLKAVWGTVLVGVSLVPMIAALVVMIYFAASSTLTFSGASGVLIISSLILSLPAIAGTILGWMGLSNIRAHAGQRRGLRLALFAALTWPLLLLVGVTLVIPAFISFRPSPPGTGLPIGAMLTLLVPAGIITFAIWAVYAAARWGGHQAASPRRGVLKWVFLALMLFGVGMFIAPRLRPARQVHRVNDIPPAATLDTNTTPWMRFTFTAVELREVQGVRWLAIDYLDDVHGECQKAFPWEATMPGHKAETRTSEFLGGDKNSPPVRHQRVEYRMPDSLPREQLEKLRDDVASTLLQKSFRLEMNERKLLFELSPAEGGSFKAWLEVSSPLKRSELKNPPEHQQVTARLETLLKREQELSAEFTDANPVVKRIREQIGEAQERIKRLGQIPLNERGPTLDRKLVIDVWPGAYPAGVTPQPDHLRWKFKCLIPPNHLAQILFVRWTNGVPTIQENFSGYYKAGKAPAEVELNLSYDKLDGSRPAHERSRWDVNLNLGSTISTFIPEEPVYRPLDTPGRMSVRSGHQRSIPLVDFAPTRESGRRPLGIRLHILLLPLKLPAIQTVPTEKDHGHFIYGMGFTGTAEEALKSIKELPIDP